MPLYKQCVVCKKEFRTKQYFVNHGGGKYCSFECHHKGLKTGEIVNCFNCGKEVYKSKIAIKRSKSKKYFCDKSCQTTWRNSEFVGDKHANWKDGMYAYRSVLKRNKIFPKCVMCGIVDKRLLAVHHVDENRKNNIVDNLRWICHNCHHLVHNYKDEKKKLMVLMV